MKIVRIFAPYLWSFKFNEGPDELSRLYELWTNQEELRDYFQNNNDVLAFYNIDIEEAIEETIENADNLYDLLSENRENLDDLFNPLSRYKFPVLNLPHYKSKRKWLRLYAIKIEANYYVITGGAIKQSQKMQENPITNNELDKLALCRNFLITNGVFDSDSMIDFIELEF